MDLREMGCEDGRWMELAQDYISAGFLISGVASYSTTR
jgi:hypothetical protein